MFSMWVSFGITLVIAVVLGFAASYGGFTNLVNEVFRGKKSTNYYSYQGEGWGFLAIFTGVIALACLLVAIIVPLTQHYDARQCGRKANFLERPTKFVVYGSGWSWECLTQSRDGKWIPVDSLTEMRGDFVTHEGTPDTSTTP
jgi:hypothetical protein